MEKIKEKLSGYRAEAEQYNALAAEHKERIKQLELQQTSKEHEILSLQTRVKNLENQLDTTENSLHEASQKYHDAEAKSEDADRKVTELENILLEKEQQHEELVSKVNVIQTELDELARQFGEL